MNSCVLIDGFLYGIDGDTTTKNFLNCVDLKTGEVRWSNEGVGMGSLLAAAGKLIVLSETGELIVALASPEGFKPMLAPKSSTANAGQCRCWRMGASTAATLPAMWFVLMCERKRSEPGADVKPTQCPLAGSPWGLPPKAPTDPYVPN